jgi:hypothetical protein
MKAVCKIDNTQACRRVEGTLPFRLWYQIHEPYPGGVLGMYKLREEGLCSSRY